MVRRGGVLNCQGSNLNHHGGNLDYIPGVSSLPTHLPDTHPYPKAASLVGVCVWRLGRQWGDPTVVI
jgi:hypothetical protein